MDTSSAGTVLKRSTIAQSVESLSHTEFAYFNDMYTHTVIVLLLCCYYVDVMHNNNIMLLLRMRIDDGFIKKFSLVCIIRRDKQSEAVLYHVYDGGSF